ncbi:hypothetical protein PybrP1_008470, partial [[Pythium] brassicae (nom. inval.)]
VLACTLDAMKVDARKLQISRGVGPACDPVEPRVAYLNDPERNVELIASKRYARNVIVTSKYTAASFVPKTMFEFFRVVANVYFLVISLLQLLTTWSPTNRYTTAGPLAFVLMVTMLKQGSEDVKRHKADEHQNNRTCRIVNASGAVETIPWRNLQVGQVLCVRNNEELPADIVILATSEEEGRCFIETCNLDGETNLKRRVAVKTTARLVGWRELNAPVLEEQPLCVATLMLKGSLEYEQPNNQLYTFTGRVLLSNDGSVTPLGPENIMLRGCGLRSCSFVLGVVIFTGAETKLLQNSRSAPSKQSKLYKTVNRCMGLIFVTMFSLCLISASVAASWDNVYDRRVWYLPFVAANGAGDFVKNFFTFLILFNNLVPISLYVSLDIIKPAAAATAPERSASPPLGIQECLIPVAPLHDPGTAPPQAQAASVMSDPKKAQVHYDPSISFDDPALLRHLNAGGKQGELIHEFLTLLSICHTVIPEVDKATGAVAYRASSPDEEALVKAAKCLGYNFVDPAPLMKVEITRKNYTAAVNRHLREFAGEGLRTLVLARRVLPPDEYARFNDDVADLETQLNDLHKAPFIHELIAKKSVSDEIAMVCDGKALVHVFPSREALASLGEDGAARAKALAAKLLAVAGRDSDLSVPVFAATILNAALHALVCFWVCFLCANRTHSLFHMGTIFYTMLLTTMKWKVLLLTLSWTRFHGAFLAFSVALFAFFLAVYPHLTFLSFDMVGVPAQMLGDDLFWYLLFVCPLAAVLADVAALTLQQQFAPTSENILRERYRMNVSPRFSGRGDVLPDNGESPAPALAGGGGGTPSGSLVFPSDGLATQASALTQLESQLRTASVHSLCGFAFNGPDSLAMSSASEAGDLVQDLVTKRVNTFSDALRTEPTRFSVPHTMLGSAAENESKAAVVHLSTAEDIDDA